MAIGPLQSHLPFRRHGEIDGRVTGTQRGASVWRREHLSLCVGRQSSGSVPAAVAKPDNLSAFAAVRSGDGALTVMVINKQQGSTPVTINLANFNAGAKAQAWQIYSAAQTAIAQLPDVTVASNALSVTVPSQSITLFVLPAGPSATPAPTATATPTGRELLRWKFRRLVRRRRSG